MGTLNRATNLSKRRPRTIKARQGKRRKQSHKPSGAAAAKRASVKRRNVLKMKRRGRA